MKDCHIRERRAMAEKKKEEFCEKHGCQMLVDCQTGKTFCRWCREDVEKANDVIEESTAEEPSNKKPLLNAARFADFGAYRLLYDIQPVDEERGIWKGRPVVQDKIKKLPGSESMEKSWMFFHRNYDDRVDWDKMYKELEIEDESIAGQKILLVPKEKLLFAYDPPPGAGIIIPMPGAVGRG